MKTFLSTIAVAAAVTIGSFAGTAPATAQDLELRIGPDGVRPVIRDRTPERERVRDRDNRRGCSEREARAAARQAGLRDPEVTRMTSRRVVVEGMTRRGPDEIVFANVRGCPEI
ncbi:hypothetical protein SAMN05880582_101810 [Rhizobium sp. RU20A]|uniref:hypothetical protein n=1 Tax=Rhizobium sp. RU20A TaxID=1907412 RepID=UPI000956DFD8|nr:hypothetical protein [Rhizobium sp. RU20A]SIQ11961.1 hypothetical protein SAMN05880582_101810 [Rhizobium sp. RU20A]